MADDSKSRNSILKRCLKMKQFEIKEYSDAYRDRLKAYLKKIAFNSSNEYVDYCVNHSSGKYRSFIVVDETDNIVGCHLNFNTQLLNKGESIDVVWRHETFLDKDFRNSAGLEFVLTINRGSNGLGIGLSDVNRIVLKKLNSSIWMDTVYNYFLLDLYFPLGVLKKILKRQLKPLKKRDIVKTKVPFKLVKNTKEIIVPNNGFWYEDIIDYDLKRDNDYLEYRFLNNKVFDYAVYEYHDDMGNSCYFVVRSILYHGIPAVLLVDYRYYGSPCLMKYILTAVKSIARSNHIGLVQTTGGMEVVENVFKSIFCIKRQAECIIDKTLKPKSSDYISITPADSDVDFNR